MFGLFASSVGGANVKQSMIERRVLCFAPETGDIAKFGSDNLGEVMEIKVFRSKGRKRVQPDLQEYQSRPGTLHFDKKGAQQQAKGGIKYASVDTECCVEVANRSTASSMQDSCLANTQSVSTSMHLSIRSVGRLLRSATTTAPGVRDF